MVVVTSSDILNMYLGLEKVFNFLNAAPGNRSVVDGEAVLHAKHLVVCGV